MNSTLPQARLRRAESQDRAFLERLFRTGPIAAVCQSAATGPMLETLLDMQFRAQATHYERAYGPEGSQVVEVESMPIGRIYLHDSTLDIRIVDMLLLPEWRGKGFGTQVLLDQLQRATVAGKSASLSVEHSNPGARKLYEQLGFLPKGEPDPLNQEMVWLPPST